MVVPIVETRNQEEDVVKNRLAWMMFSTLCFAAPSSGCHITTCEHGSVCGFEDERARQDACQSLCERLVVCGNVASSDHEACMSSCFDDYDREPASTAGACRCVARASCSEIAERHCPSAPPIGGGYTTGSTTSGGTTTSSTATSTGTTTSTGTSTSGSGGAPGYDAAGAGGSPGASDAGLPPCGHD